MTTLASGLLWLAGMRPRLSALLVIALAGAVAVPAHAEGFYVGVGMGPGATLASEIADHFSTDGQIAGRVIAGTRMGNLAVEASCFGTDFSPYAYDFVASSSHSSVSVGAGAKLYLPLAHGIEIYARGGLDKTWVSGSDLSGRGYDYGVGVQRSLRLLPGLAGAVWLDVGRQVVRLHPGTGAAIDGQLTMITLGMSFGSKL